MGFIDNLPVKMNTGRLMVLIQKMVCSKYDPVEDFCADSNRKPEVNISPCINSEPYICLKIRGSKM